MLLDFFLQKEWRVFYHFELIATCTNVEYRLGRNDITEGDFQLSDEGDLELIGTSRDAGDSELAGTNEDAGELCWMEPGEEVWFGNKRELHCRCSWAETVQ